MKQKKQTSENVSEAVCLLSRLAKIIADTASLEFVARGRKMKEMKKAGILVASEKLSTTSTRGSANAAAIRAPSINRSTALMEVHLASLTPSPSSSLLPPTPTSRRSCSLLVSWKEKPCQTQVPKEQVHELEQCTTYSMEIT